MQTRLKFVALLFFLAFVSLLTKLFLWQIARGRELSGKARIQYKEGSKIGAGRGNILASDRSWLAARGDAWLVTAAIPELSGDKKKIADKLGPFFVNDSESKEQVLTEVDRIYSLLTKKETVWVPLKHKVGKEAKKNIEALKIPGIDFEVEEERVYPEASAAAQLLGFVGKNDSGEDVGYFGLEGYYNLSLSGKTGFKSREKDARGLPIVTGDSKEVSAVSGVDLLTHIDKTIQLVVERKLFEGIEKYGAKGGSVVVINPKNGAVLAMSSYPSYDPAKYFEYGDEYFKNPVISDSFEPGSIFKPLVMAGALDAGVVTPETKCDVCGGPVKVDKYEIETWDKKYHPDSTMIDIIVHSDNVGMTFVGSKLGAEKLYNYLNAFGLGKPTEIDLQGEGNPPLREQGSWNVVDLATATFGQGVAVTPIQIATAFGAIANRGVIARPQVVAKITKEGWSQDIKPEFGQKVISEKTSEEVTDMMVEAVKNGEAKWTQAKGFSIAGKTGTAQIPVSGHYDKEKTIASFIGFAPANNAKFLMLVTLREPTTSPWGSETAAPLWFSIARDLFPYLGIQPEN